MGIQKTQASAKNNVDMVELKWHEIRDRVYRVNATLAEIIDEFEPTEKHTFYKIKYPYGIKIRDKGDFYIPNADGNFIPLRKSETSINSRKFIDPNTSPVWLILDKSCEIYVETPEKRSIPIKHFYPGAVLGVWELMEQSKVSIRQDWTWKISAGARTLFMLPSIAEAKGHNRLKEAFSLRSYTPNTIFDHHGIFSEIANKSNVDWSTEILLFNKEWLKPHLNNIGWIKLREYWSRLAWDQMLYWANNVNLNLCWESFLAELTCRNYKPNPYLLDTIKHLVSIGTNTIPGFRPIDNDQIVAPTHLIEQAYTEIYQLKYAPIIMQPDFLIRNNQANSIYYSLQYPTLLEKPVEFKSFPSVMKMMHQLKLLMNVLLELMQTWPQINNQNLYDFSDHIEYDFFHSENDKRGEMKSTNLLIQSDPLMMAAEQRFKDKAISSASHFLRGCIRTKLRE